MFDIMLPSRCAQMCSLMGKVIVTSGTLLAGHLYNGQYQLKGANPAFQLPKFNLLLCQRNETKCALGTMSNPNVIKIMFRGAFYKASNFAYVG